MSQPISAPVSYTTAANIHAWAMERGMVARVCCDNAAPDPAWWVEAYQPNTHHWARLS